MVFNLFFRIEPWKDVDRTRLLADEAVTADAMLGFPEEMEIGRAHV